MCVYYVNILSGVNLLYQWRAKLKLCNLPQAGMAIKKDINIVLIEAHTIFRYGIQKLFEAEEGFSIIGEAEDGSTGVGMALELRPDIVLLEIDLPSLNGIEATRRITTITSTVHVIALSCHSSDGGVIDFFGAGGRGFVSKNCTFSELKSAIYAVVQGNKYLSVQVAGILVDRAFNSFSTSPASNQTPLSHRECEILQLVSEGETSGDIAKKLGISKRTVNNHRKNIMDKLNIHNIAQLTRYAIVNGISLLAQDV